jgi:DNA helicase-2/ATP-dependent DNA helicase PcrA
MVEKGVSVFDAVATCRGSGLSDQAVSPGVNLLNGHRGKGQEFDWVVVLGLEDGQIPDFRNEDDPDELRILHVMVSRARYGLLFTYARNTMTGYGWRAARQSRWLSVLRRTAKEEMVA